MKNLKIFLPLWKFIKEDKFKIIFASLLMLTTSLSEIFTGYLNGAAIEAITKLDLKASIGYLLAYLVIVLIFIEVLYNLGSRMLHKIENKISRKLSYFSYKKALDLPAYAYEQKSSGEIINRITNDADSLSSSFGQILDIIDSILTTLVIFIYIIFNSWIIGLEILIVLCFLYRIQKKYNPLLKEIHKDVKEENDKFISQINESIRGIREIKTLGIKSNLLDNMQFIIKNIFRKSSNEIDLRKKFQLLNSFIKSFLEVTVFITCAILLYNKQITLTFFVAMTYYIYRYTWLIERLNSFSQNYQQLTVSMERVNEILENKLFKDEKFGNMKLQNIQGIIEFKDVTFAYPNESPTLKNMSLKVEPNMKIAIVGKSGQGKSTIFNLLTRVFDPNKGQILLDGIDIKDLTEEELRKHISIIRQEPFVFNRTIKENFELIDKNIKTKEIREYTNMAYLDDYIMSLPKKYNTILGEGGVNLSGGQKQRLAIARTLAKKSKIILFDEATSALDNNSQDYIKKTIDNFIKDHTVLIVAHRLSTIIDADIIHVVDNGKIVASGTHKELLEKCEIYQKLYESEI